MDKTVVLLQFGNKFYSHFGFCGFVKNRGQAKMPVKFIIKIVHYSV